MLILVVLEMLFFRAKGLEHKAKVKNTILNLLSALSP